MSNVINDVVNVATFGLIDDATGTGAAAEASQNASNAAIAQQNKALEYLKEREKLPQELRESALTKLASVYGLGEGGTGKPDFSSLLNDPYIKAQVERQTKEAEESLLRNAGMTGLTRSGNINQALMENIPKIQENAINDYLGGLKGFAGMQGNENNIANLMTQIGQTQAQGILAPAQANQAMTGQLITGGLAGLGAFLSDRRLKTNIKYVGMKNKHKWYQWDWNELANKLGLFGSSEGVMADEVKHIPGAVSEYRGFDTVNYNVLGV